MRKFTPLQRLDARREALRAWMDAREGVVTWSELAVLRFTPRETEGMVQRKELIRVRRGVYRGRGLKWDLRAELRAALSQQGDDARLVLISGLHWQGLLFRPAALPEIGVPGDGDTQRLRTRVVYRTPYANAKPLVHDGLPCAAPVDALPHLAGHVRGDHGQRRALRRAVREAVRRDAPLATKLQLVAAKRFPGALELRTALASLAGALVVRSDMEEDFIRFCEIWALPPFLMNQKVDGVERDAVRPDERLIVELDTRRYHGNLVSMESDRARRRRATVADWKHLEITGVDLRNEPGRVAADLAIVLGLTDWSPPADAASRWAEVLNSAEGIWLPKT